MKNNRTTTTVTQTKTILRRLGEPKLLAGLFDDEADQGILEIALIDLSDPEHQAFYKTLHNSPNEFEVLQEDDYSGRTTVFTVVRYLRKSACNSQLPPKVSKGSSPKKSEKSQKPKTKVAGFSAATQKKPKGKQRGRSQP